MRITAAQVTNFKRIQHVAITPDSDRSLILVGGDNAQGKSSFMDALTAAFGGASSLPTDPVRHGAETAEIRVELDGGALIIKRTIQDGKSTLELRDADGRLREPQARLDKIVGERFLDPLAFLALSAKDQRKSLLAIVDRDGTVAELEERRIRLFDRRTELSRDHKRSAAQLDGTQAVEPAPPIDVGALTTELSTLDERKQAVVRARYDQERARAALRSAISDVERINAEMEALAGRLVAAEELVERCRELEKTTDATVGALPIADLDKQRSEVVMRMQRASEHNRSVGALEAQARRRTELAKEVETLDADVKKLNAELEKIETEKRAVLAAAKLPVEELDVDADVVRFRGVPLAQASGAEQLRVALAIAIAASPKLRDVWVRDGSLLDDDSLQTLAREAAAAGVRVWVERVGDRDPGAIVIHDGRVREDG